MPDQGVGIGGETLGEGVYPFEIADTAVRGKVVRLGDAVDTILTRHNYPDRVSELLGEAAALTCLLGADLKNQGKLILQTRGNGPISMLVADYTAGGGLRGYAAGRNGGFESDGKNKADQEGDDLHGRALLGEGYIAFTIDYGPDTDRYQGVTPLEGETLRDCALGYFDRSEQIPTALHLAVGRVQTPGESAKWRAGGIILQHVPSEGGGDESGAPRARKQDEDLWERASTLLATTQADELLDPNLAPNDLLYRLFHEDGVKVFEPRPVAFMCSCSREKIEAVLNGYDAATRAEMAEDGVIYAKCEFCNETYAFPVEAVGAS